jgi:S-adenosylmethionine:tRNA ribosyltransferase-isomerase
MLKTDFSFDLPKNLIAQTPIENRDHSRLLVLSKNNNEIKDDKFFNIIDYLNEGDLLVLNNSRVLPARLYGIKENSTTKIEFLLLEQKSKNTWEVLIKPAKKLKVGARVLFEDGKLIAEILEIKEDGNRVVEFSFEGIFFEILEEIGLMPLPHYITEELNEKERYQTVYSKDVGSAAAPTAGLHFTNELLQKIKSKGVNIAYVTLHVGLGTFRPVKVDNITEHKMHSENYHISQETADLINSTKKSGGKVVGVGTTSCRVLESVATFEGEIKEYSGNTDIFIYPGYKFKVIDALITNFHLPQSTLIMLVSAFYGYEKTMNAYKYAVENEYRFFSFGDAMIIK